VRIDCVTHVPSAMLASGHGETWCGKPFLIGRQQGHLFARRASDSAEIDCMACIAGYTEKGF
jgi:hypothetical protein